MWSEVARLHYEIMLLSVHMVHGIVAPETSVLS